MKVSGLRIAFFYIMIIIAINSIAQELRETTTVYMEVDGTVGVSKKSFFGLNEKYYVARSKNHKWETKLLYEKKFGKAEARNEPWKEIFYSDY